ncbi:hypothetical protein [Tomitella cavernea]|uniref:Uncharacterized protein n=1 Tax=Tomitella cavernea TaxID=1387982 RepID=A0ABP9C3S6_9ACTN|nr:hypothetical protein [Tomitella cavernea]
MSASGLAVEGPWGHSFGSVDLDLDLDLDLDVASGGVMVIPAPVGCVRHVLMLTLCGRQYIHSGELSILSFDNQPRNVFAQSMIVRMDAVDEIERSVRVRELIEEERRWNSSLSARRNRMYTMERLHPPVEV